jgi:two-component system, chemotaxis family, sensor kinase CheA
MDEIVKDFLIESNENLDRLDQELVKLESDPTSKDLLAGIFRTIHTIKGSCGFLGFARLEKVAHAGENLLSRLRDGALSLNAEITSGLLAMVDAVRKMLAEIQATEHDGDNDYPELLSKMKDLQGNVKSSDPKPLMQATPKAANPAEAANPTGEVRILEAAEAPAQPASPPSDSAPSVQNPAPPQPFPPTSSKIGGVLVDRGSLEVGNLALALQEQERGDRRRRGEILVALGFCRQEDVNAAQQILESRAHQAGVETVRVGVDLLDTLMTLIGELAISCFRPPIPSKTSSFNPWPNA